jgi:hypothetical protein
VFPPRFVSSRESQKPNKNNNIQRISVNQNVTLLRFLQLEYFTEIQEIWNARLPCPVALPSLSRPTSEGVALGCDASYA